MNNDIKKVLLSTEEIETKAKELGKILAVDYAGKTPILLGLLKGSIPFIGDLMKQINIPLQVEFMDVSSYHGGTSSSGQVKILKDLDVSVEGRHIIIVEDIVDTGFTLTRVIELLKHRGAASVEVVTMLDKPEGRVVTMEPKYVGFTVPKEFVVGYGLDYNELYRNLPYVGVLKEEVYMK
ncbi:MAG TPA: hypoxanthine phosphoribosyltransferase [Firmicutes bacterium]|nr:hypoxanthine phosphoribosyltransferase [Bacillota bacterium]